MSDNDKNIVHEDYGKIKSPLLSKIDNFFYHYKWHTLIVLFIVITFTVCTLQMCKRTTYDIHIMYAGGTYVSVSASEGEAESGKSALTNACKPYLTDRDGDGLKNIDFLSLFIPSAEQIKEAEENIADGYYIDYGQISQNRKDFDQHIMFGDYYVAFISESLYKDVTENEKNNRLVPISSYLPEGYEEKGYVLAGEYGVYLSSTPLADDPGFKNLEPDTVVCIKALSELKPSKKDIAYYTYCEEVLKRMLGN